MGGGAQRVGGPWAVEEEAGGRGGGFGTVAIVIPRRFTCKCIVILIINITIIIIITKFSYRLDYHIVETV